MLGIMAYFTEVIDKPFDRVPVSQKRLALKAVHTLITIAGTQIGIALPQVCSCIYDIVHD